MCWASCWNLWHISTFRFPVATYSMVSGTSAAYMSFFFLLLSLPLLPWQWLLTLSLASHNETEKSTHHLSMPLDISSFSLHLFSGLDDTEKIPAMSFLTMKCAWIGTGTHQLVIWVWCEQNNGQCTVKSPALLGWRTAWVLQVEPSPFWWACFLWSAVFKAVVCYMCHVFVSTPSNVEVLLVLLV